jgi:hypothetical protein
MLSIEDVVGVVVTTSRMRLPLHRAAMFCGLLVCVDCASISIESHGIRPDIGEKELRNARERVLRREVADHVEASVAAADAEEIEPTTVQSPKAPESLTEVQAQTSGQNHFQNQFQNHPIAAQEFRHQADWAHEAWEETGSLPAAPSHHYAPEMDPWLPQPPKIHHVPFEDKPVGYWKFEDNHHLKHGHYAANRWHPYEHTGGPPHFGVSGHWDFGGHGGHHHQAEPLTLREKMKLRNADRRDPAVPKWDQTWPPADGEGYKYHGHWAWNDNNGYKHPDWVRPEEILSKGGAALGPGRWAWNWQHQNEIWKPMPREEYEKWRDHIHRVSPDHSIYETSNDPVCASCAGGCALPGKCEFQASSGLSLKQECIMKEGKLCAESFPGVKPPEPEFAPPPPNGAGPHESILGAGHWQDMDWVPGGTHALYSGH